MDSDFFNFEALNLYTNIKGGLIMGGTGVEDNFRVLDEGCQFIIGTPGRVYDMMKRYVLKTNKLKYLEDRLKIHNNKITEAI